MSIAILGYGTVAKGTLDELCGTDADVKYILVRRDIPEIAEKAVRDYKQILADPDIELVAELMGGEEPAYTYVRTALEAGKHVVSANKQMLSKHFAELVPLAKEKGVTLAFSAAAGGGIPWLPNLLRYSRTDRLISVSGIMNGTTNLILSEMFSEGSDFDAVLKKAQDLGFAEADPTADIDGLDVRAKLALSCDIASGLALDPDSIPALGIRYITASDVKNFKEAGLVCKLIGKAEFRPEGVCAYVEPMLFKAGAPETGIGGPGNIISMELEKAGKFSFIGAGAGREATGNAVANDILDALAGRSVFSAAKAEGAAQNAPGLSSHRYYIGGEITEPITVAEVHALVKKRIAAGEKLFAAGFAE
ncbi:MAG: homoserine dehydrogenase [Firmicutes bacterium]|nr:homoserine dehydrogenase [Bacillota bacterium]